MPNYLMSDNVVYANTRTLYQGGTATAVANGDYGLVQFLSLVDGDDYYDTSTGQYEVKFTGILEVQAGVSSNAADRNRIAIKRNNTTTGTAGLIYTGVIGASSTVEMSVKINVTKGDLISIHLHNLTGGSLTLSTSNSGNWVSFSRVADYSAGQPVGFKGATPTQYGLVKKNTIESIVLEASESSTVTDIATNGNASNSGFKFTDLVIGDWYEIKIQAFLSNTGSSTLEQTVLNAIHNGATVCRVLHRSDAATDIHALIAGNSRIFQATASDITFDFIVNGSGILQGSGGIDQTYSQLIKRNDL